MSALNGPCVWETEVHILVQAFYNRYLKQRAGLYLFYKGPGGELL